MLVASPPGGPSEPVRGACHWLDDQRAEQCGDLVAGERDLTGWRRMGVLGGGGDGQERQGEHGQGGPAVPGVPPADLVLIQSGQSFARLASLPFHWLVEVDQVRAALWSDIVVSSGAY
jgi:hypothetical protein